MLSGCSNALYFYETEKISLTVEARPDSSQPVQGSVGVKQRVALVTPGTQSATMNSTQDNEALSAISSFGFKIIPTSGTLFDPILIQTAFVTGEAASQLNAQETAAVANAIVVEGSYRKDDCGDKLRAFWKPNGTDIEKTNQTRLTQWMKMNALDPDAITAFLRLGSYAAQRCNAVAELGL